MSVDMPDMHEEGQDIVCAAVIRADHQYGELHRELYAMMR